MARAEALSSARELLLRLGPEAVTLKAVANGMGVSHANLIHRFGSAAGLQSALMAQMVEELGSAIRVAAAEWRASDDSSLAGLVEPVFRAFDEGGAGRLAARIALSGDLTHLAPVQDALGELLETLTAAFPDAPDVKGKLVAAVLLTALVAFGDAVIGTPLKQMLNAEEDVPRSGVLRLLATLIETNSA